MSFSIRFARPSDSTKIYCMIIDLAQHQGSVEKVKLSNMQLQEQLASKACPFRCIVAESDDGELAAFAIFFQTYSTWEGAPCMYLEDLYVRPQDRKSGLGRLIMDHLRILASSEGCPRLEWSVIAGNHIAEDFYIKLGANPLPDWTRWRMDCARI